MAGTPVELSPTEHRFAGTGWIETGGQVLISDFDRDRRWRRTFLLSADDRATPPRLLWDMSADERYADPGNPIYEMLPTGTWAVLRHERPDLPGGPGRLAPGRPPVPRPARPQDAG